MNNIKDIILTEEYHLLHSHTNFNFRYLAEHNLLDLIFGPNINPEILVHMVEYGSGLDAQDEYGLNALHYACQYGIIEIVEIFVRKIVRLNCRDNNSYRPIHYACAEGHLNIVKYLDQHSIELVDIFEPTKPIDLAVENSQTKIIEYLNSKKLKLNKFE